MERISEKRRGKNMRGFSVAQKPEQEIREGDIPASELLRHCEPEDMLRFGMIPEFIGRLPILATLGDLSEPALIEILTRPKNALAKQYQRMFEMEGVKLRFQEEALHAI